MATPSAATAKAVIYLATNEVNGKRYIGVTSRFKERKQEHRRASEIGVDRLINRAIRKYSFEAFSFTIIAECENYEDGLAEERRLIGLLKPEYNLTAGGESTIGYKHTPEQLARRGLRPCPLKGRSRSPGTIAKMSASLKGKKLNLTDEARAIRRAQAEAMRALKRGPHSAKQRAAASAACKLKRRPVLCIETGETFLSAMHAEMALGLYPGAISRSATLGAKVSNRHYRYIDETPVERDRRCRPRLMRPGKHVVCLNDGLIFRSAREADRYYGLYQRAVDGVASGKQSNARGLTFKYVDDASAEYEEAA